MLLEVSLSFVEGRCRLLEPLRDETEELLRVGRGTFPASMEDLDRFPSLGRRFPSLGRWVPS